MKLSRVVSKFYKIGLVGLAACLFSAEGMAQMNDDFRQYLIDICTSPNPPPPGSDIPGLIAMCFKLNPGGAAGGVTPVASVSGSTSVASFSSNNQAAGSQSKKAQALQDEQEQSGQGGSADYQFGNLGLTFAVQRGQTERKQTTLENGYESYLSNAFVALSYQFSDQLVAGMGVAASRSRAHADLDLGSIDIDSTSGNLFVTYLPTDRIYLSAYLGYADLDFESQRRIGFVGPITTSVGKTDGSQETAGLSAGYVWSYGDWDLSPYLNIDYSKTKLDGFAEVGISGLEFIYENQTDRSLTSTLGMRISKILPIDNGSFIPELRFNYVHEYEFDAKTTASELAILPGGSKFLTRTDKPDRDYFIWGVGFVADATRDVQLFLDFEKQEGHSLFDTWTAGGGAVISF